MAKIEQVSPRMLNRRAFFALFCLLISGQRRGRTKQPTAPLTPDEIIIAERLRRPGRRYTTKEVLAYFNAFEEREKRARQIA